MEILGSIFNVLGNELIIISNSKNLKKLGSKVYYKEKYLGNIIEYFGNTNSPFYVVFLKNKTDVLKKGEIVFVGEIDDRKKNNFRKKGRKHMSCLRK